MPSVRSVTTSFRRPSTGPVTSVPSTIQRPPEQLHRVYDLQLVTEPARVGGDLQRAAGVARGDPLGAGVDQVARFALAQFGGRLGLDQFVDARRATADLPLVRLHQFEAGDRA